MIRVLILSKVLKYMISEIQYLNIQIFSKVFKVHDISDTIFFVLSGIHNLSTIDQIKDGKHLCRCLEAYFAMYFALYEC